MTGPGSRRAGALTAVLIALVAGGCTTSPGPLPPTPSSGTAASGAPATSATPAREVCAREADAAARLLRAGGSAPRQLIAQLGVDTKMYQVATRLDQIYTYTRISQDPATADRHTRVAALAVCEANGDPTLTPAELVELEKSAAPIDVVALRQLDLPD